MKIAISGAPYRAIRGALSDGLRVWGGGVSAQRVLFAGRWVYQFLFDQDDGELRTEHVEGIDGATRRLIELLAHGCVLIVDQGEDS